MRGGNSLPKCFHQVVEPDRQPHLGNLPFLLPVYRGGLFLALARAIALRHLPFPLTFRYQVALQHLVISLLLSPMQYEKDYG